MDAPLIYGASHFPDYSGVVEQPSNLPLKALQEAHFDGGRIIIEPAYIRRADTLEALRHYRLYGSFGYIHIAPLGCDFSS